MLPVALVLVSLAAALHVYIFVLESVRWEHPATRKVFGTTAEQAAIMSQLALNQGFYNLFLAIGTGLGVALHAAYPTVGETLIWFGAGSMVAAALVLVLSDRTKLRAAMTQGTVPALGLLALALSR